MAAIVLAIHVIFLFVFIISFSHESSALGGFGTRIFHRDSPHSPLYNPNITAYDREIQAFQRSIARLHYFDTIKSSSASPDGLQSPVNPGRGDYVMTVSIGTPSINITGVVDTGSSLVWTQCMPCKECFKQDTHIFDPSKSSTFSTVPCDNLLCESLARSSCGSSCQYEIRYADGSRSSGDFALETFTFDSTDGADNSVPDIAFGCGHDNSGLFDSYETGVFGLGRGPFSFVSQLGPLANKRFSYCLTPNKYKQSGSLLLFGDLAVVPKYEATPMIRVAGLETFYFMNLNDVSVGWKRLNLPPNIFHRTLDGKRGMVIDSGSTITFLHVDGFTPVVNALKEVIRLETTPFFGHELCYKGTGADLRRIPYMTFHFDGVSVTLVSANTFQEVIPGVLCLNIAPTNDLSIFGNRLQQDYNIGYDLDASIITFTQTDCAAH